MTKSPHHKAPFSLHQTSFLVARSTALSPWDTTDFRTLNRRKDECTMNWSNRTVAFSLPMTWMLQWPASPKMNMVDLEAPTINLHCKHSKSPCQSTQSNSINAYCPCCIVSSFSIIARYVIFDTNNITYVHPDIQIRPSNERLKASADWLIKRAARRALIIGAAGGSLGYAGIL